MEKLERKPLQGIINIIRFNRHYYIIALVTVIVLLLIKSHLHGLLYVAAILICLFTILSTVISLVISWYVYDYSGLYSLNWLNNLSVDSGNKLVNINAGFDETSWLIMEKYPGTNLQVFDFYDAAKHTEISIERARKAYAAYRGTKTINTTNVPLQENSVDYIFLILSAHEIRSNNERIIFFKQLAGALHYDGRIIVTEHQRDINNFIAYNIGFLHFLSINTWKQTFSGAGLSIDSILKINPFISTYILKKSGAAS